MSATITDFSPRGLQTGQGNPFILSKEEWISIQKYVQDALSLPTTDAAMRTAINVNSTTDVSMFKEAMDDYKIVSGHCSTWKYETYPSSVNLANDIVHYNIDVKVCYPALGKLVDSYNQNPSDSLKNQIAALIGKLAKDAGDYADRADQVQKAITQFSNDTGADKTMLTNLKADYDKKYGTDSAEVIAINKNLVAQKLILDSANAEYNHDVIVAATTPTYAWVPFAGWIAASIVAGIYGHKAVEALHEAEAAQNQINTLNDQLKRDTNAMNMITSAEKGLTNILTDISAALTVIQKIQGIWGAINSDMSNLKKIINDDISQAMPILMGIGIQEAIEQWQQLADEANGYRVNAYVDFQESAQPQAA